MEQETTIDLRELLEILRKRIWIVVIVTLLASAASGVISFFVLTPIYESSTQLLVNKSENKNELMLPTRNDIEANLQLISTYNVIIKSPRILEKAITNMDLEMTAGKLSDKVKVSAVQDSQVMSITVTDPDPAMAVKKANGIAATFQQEIQTIMSIDNVQILAEAKVPVNPSPVKPKPILNIAIAFVVGLMASVGIIFLLEYLDNTIKTEHDVEQILGLTVLGAIAKIDYKSEDKASKTAPSSPKGGKGIEAQN